MPKSYKGREEKAALRDALAPSRAPRYEVELRDLKASPLLPAPRMPRGAKRSLWVLLADCHHPYHDPATWNIVLQAGRDLQPDGLVVMGDWLDFDSITSHEKSHTGTNLFDEIAAADGALDEIDEAYSSAWFRKFLRGNHEWRLDRYVAGPRCPPELRKMIPSLDAALHLKQRGYEYITDKPVNLGTDHLFIHGHFYSKHHASRHLDALWENTVYGHTHMPQQFTHSTPLVAPTRRVAVATGLPTIRDLSREWHEEKRVHTWVNGFGVMEFAGDRAFVRNVYVVEGKAVYARHVWDASHLFRPGAVPSDPRIQR